MQGLIEMTPLLFHSSSTLSFLGDGAMRQLIPRLPVLHSKAARISKSDPALLKATLFSEDSTESLYIALSCLRRFITFLCSRVTVLNKRQFS